jgi:hypothetical protein
MINPTGKCQYCGGASPNTRTCKDCVDGWPYEKCRCENNGDYCWTCADYIEARREKVRLTAPERKKLL